MRQSSNFGPRFAARPKQSFVRFFFSVFLVALFSGCASSYYGPFDIKKKEGYNVSYALDGRPQAMVGFAGDEYCKPERVYDLALLRAAEVTKKKGYEYFVILSTKDISAFVRRSLPPPVAFRGYSMPGGGSVVGGTAATGGMVIPRDDNLYKSPRQVLLIEFRHTQATDMESFSPGEVITRIRAKYKMGS